MRYGGCSGWKINQDARSRNAATVNSQGRKPLDGPGVKK
jgi:hypothetical protein